MDCKKRLVKVLMWAGAALTAALAYAALVCFWDTASPACFTR